MNNVCLLIIIFVQLINCNKLHNFTKEEIHNIFKIPEKIDTDYDVVPVVHTLHKRNTITTLRIQAFQQNLELYLEPNENYLFGKDTPVYLARKSKFTRKGVNYDRFYHNLDFKLYHNKTHAAALMIQHNNNGIIEVRGVIGDMVIYPTPNDSHYKNKRMKTNYSEDPLCKKNNEEYTIDHIIVKQKNYRRVHKSIQSISNKLLNIIRGKESNLGNNVYPEILVTMDYKTFKKHNKNIENIITYMVVFWNGVDLKFRTVDEHQIRLNIAGIIIPQDKDAAPYIQNHLLDKNTLRDVKVLNSLSSYFYEDTYFSKNSYDIVVALTNYRIGSRTWLGYINQTTGVTNYAGACQSSFWYRSLNSVALVKDNSKFDGILSAAHEIAHLMGATHDGQELKSSNIPGAEDCPRDGYIMGAYHKDERRHRWSSCSLRSMSVFLQSDSSSCLRNKPTIINPYPKFLPGRIANLEDQCNAFQKGSLPCNDGYNNSLGSVCHRLYCGTPPSNCNYAGVALDGSPCNGYTGTCLIGDCVPLPKNF